MADKRVKGLHKGHCPTGWGRVMKTGLREAVWSPSRQEEAEWVEGLLIGHCSERGKKEGCAGSATREGPGAGDKLRVRGGIGLQ